MKKLFISAALLLTTLASVSAQTADEVINKYIDAIGGKDKWLSLKTIKIEGQIEVQGISIPFTMQAVHDKANRMDAEFQGMKIVEIVTPQTGWSMNGFQGQSSLQPMSQEDLKTKVDNLDLQDQLIDYANNGRGLNALHCVHADAREIRKLPTRS